MDPEAQRPKKRQRLEAVQAFHDKLPYVSQTALAEILKLAQSAPLPKASTRRDIRQARDQSVQVNTPYGTVHKTVKIAKKGGSNVPLEISDPWAFLWHACHTKSSCASLIERTLARHPCSYMQPWRLIFYTDEVGPGNQLAYRNARKFDAVYWSILEFGAGILSDEHAWFVLAVCRASLRSELIGSTIGLANACLETFSNADRSMRSGGIQLDLHGGRKVHLWLQLDMFIADADALRAALGWKGAGGLKPCPLCQNVFAYGSRLTRGCVERDASGWSVYHTCTDASKFVLHTTASLRGERVRTTCNPISGGPGARARRKPPAWWFKAVDKASCAD